MSYTAGNVMDQVAALLTDPSKVTHTYALMLSYLKISWDELQEALLAKGIVDLDEKSATKTITAGIKVWNTDLPTDLLLPVKLYEKAVGALDTTYELMDQEEINPAEELGTTLEVWNWEEGEVKLRGATTDRVLLLKYQRELAAIASENTVLPVTVGKMFLTFRTAGIISEIRGNKTRAASFNGSAEYHLGKILGVKVRESQNVVVRAKPYGHSRRANRRLS